MVQKLMELPCKHEKTITTHAAAATQTITYEITKLNVNIFIVFI